MMRTLLRALRLLSLPFLLYILFLPQPLEKTVLLSSFETAKPEKALIRSFKENLMAGERTSHVSVFYEQDQASLSASFSNQGQVALRFIQSDYFSLFKNRALAGSLPGLEGERRHFIILSVSAAHLFYGTIQCVGQTLYHENQAYTILAVVSDENDKHSTKSSPIAYLPFDGRVNRIAALAKQRAKVGELRNMMQSSSLSLGIARLEAFDGSLEAARLRFPSALSLSLSLIFLLRPKWKALRTEVRKRTAKGRKIFRSFYFPHSFMRSAPGYLPFLLFYAGTAAGLFALVYLCAACAPSAHSAILTSIRAESLWRWLIHFVANIFHAPQAIHAAWSHHILSLFTLVILSFFLIPIALYEKKEKEQ